MRAERKKGTLFMGGGLLLLAAALFLTGHNVWEEHRAEHSAAAALAQFRQKLPAAVEQSAPPEESGETVLPDYLLDPEMEMPTVELDGEDYIGVLSIPTLDLELPVLSQWSYPRLKLAPCRFEGSAYLGDLIIAGHNYRGHFGGLKNLRAGDEVSFTDAEGNAFSYRVAELELLGGNDLERLESGTWDLTLFTCTTGGKTRVAVRCETAEGA